LSYLKKSRTLIKESEESSMNPTRKIRLLAAAGALALLGTVGGVAPAAAATAAAPSTPTSTSTSTFEQLINHDGKCLGVSSASTANGAAAIQFTCNGAASQYWDLKPVIINGIQYQLIENLFSGKCLTVQNNDPNIGGAVVQETCNNSGSDKFEDWYPFLDTGRWYIIYNVGNQSGTTSCYFNLGIESTPCAMHPSGNGSANALHIFDNVPFVTGSDAYLWESGSTV
jgi:Ricin-type beta-trefoil lectin domain-like